jgi:hypothetical protein
MKLVPIKVECYAGFEGDESPRRFTWEGQLIEVEEVLDRWHQVEGRLEWPRANYFKVRDVNQIEYLLKHDLEVGEWYLGKIWRQWPMDGPASLAD